MKVIASLINILPIYLLEEKEKGNNLRLPLGTNISVNKVVLCK